MDLIQDRIRKTRRQVKGVDIIAGLLTLIVGGLVYLFLTALADHWLVSGGLGFGGRFFLWSILIIAAGLYFVKFAWPPMVLSINPVFAAQTIEQCKPSLKNSLINFLLLRGRQRELAPVIYQALEQRAASDLVDVQIETAVDRRPVLRLCYLLLGVVGVICLYLAVSPKSPITSAQRVLWPWSRVRAPTRVNIENVLPGDATAFLGDFLFVSAEVKGLNQGEAVLLHYSTADGEILDQVVPMTDENGAYRRQAKLPPDARGLQQDYTYFIAAGDCKTAIYRIQTQIPPLIDVDRIDYHYPAYTGLPDRSVRHQGDIRDIEGTQITIHALANQPIGRAEIDFSGTGAPGVKMNVTDRAAVGQFLLRMHPDDPTRAEHDSYQLRFTDVNRRENRRPIRYNIQVIRDLPPDVQIVVPQEDRISLPQDGRLQIRVTAADPDYGLNRVAIRAESETQGLNIPPLLNVEPPEKSFSGTCVFDPSIFNLKPGDIVSYRAEAEDNKEPSHNRTATAPKQILIVEPAGSQAKNAQQPHRAKRPDDQSDNNSPDQQSSDRNQNDQSQSGRSLDDRKQPQNQAENRPGDKGGQDKNNTQNDNRDQKKQENQNNSQQKSADKSQSAGKGDSSQSGNQGDSAQAGNKGDSSQSGKNGDQSGSSQSGQNERQSDANQTANNQEPVDPNTNPGDAMQQILKHRQAERQKEQNNALPGEQQNDKQNNQQPGKNKSDNGNQTADNQKQGEKQPGEKQPSGEKRQPGNERQSADSRQPGDKLDENQPDADRKSNNLNQSAGRQPKTNDGQTPDNLNPGSDAQGTAQPKTDQTGLPAQDRNKKPEEGKSPGASSNKSDKTDKISGSAGDRSGQSEKGDGQQNKKPGQGDNGSQTPEKQDASKTNSKNRDQPGGKSGDQPQGRDSGNPAGKQQSSPGSNDKNQPGGEKNDKKDSADKNQPGGEKNDKKDSADKNQPGEKTDKKDSASGREQSTGSSGDQGRQKPRESGDANDKDQKSPDASADKNQTKPSGAEGEQSKQDKSPESSSGKDQQKQSEGSPSEGQKSGDKSGKKQSGSASGNPTDGGGPGPAPNADAQPEAQPPEADAANLDFAQKQTVLALEHLEEQLDKDRPELLERLGWTREQAQRFIDHWRQMRDAAEKKGPDGEAAKKEFDNALKSLGLRPGATVIKHGGVQSDQLRDMRDSGRFAPPPGWAEQFREYTRGVANKGKATADKDRETGK